MEKLIELLNEYEMKAVVHWYEWYGQDVLMCRYVKDGFEFYTDEATTIAISKYYGFIKWLVENDKIDFKKNKLQVLKDIDVRGEVMYDYTLFDKVDGVIMLLSISDTPIEDLILYLK